jgi:hypothetical protein
MRKKALMMKKTVKVWFLLEMLFLAESCCQCLGCVLHCSGNFNSPEDSENPQATAAAKKPKVKHSRRSDPKSTKASKGASASGRGKGSRAGRGGKKS